MDTIRLLISEITWWRNERQTGWHYDDNNARSLGWTNSVQLAIWVRHTLLIRKESCYIEDTQKCILLPSPPPPLFSVTICFQSFYLLLFESLSKTLLNQSLVGFIIGMSETCAFLSDNVEFVKVVHWGHWFHGRNNLCVGWRYLELGNTETFILLCDIAN